MNLMMAERWTETAFGTVIKASALASVLIVLVLVVQWIAGRRLGPSWRFALWGIVLVRLLMPTAPESGMSLFNAKSWFAVERAAPPVKLVKTQAPLMAMPGAVELPVGSGVEFPAEISVSASAGKSIPWWMILTWVWAAGVVWHVGRLVIGSIWLGRRVRRVEAPEVETILEAAARELGMRRKPELVESSLVVSPALFGVFRPRLVVPAGFVDRMSGRELRHVFLHELVHLRRGDLIANGLMAVAQGLHWMNPLVWLAMRQMRVERELACDELVLQRTGRDPNERHAYGATILRLIEGLPAHRSFSAAVGIAEEKHSARKRMAQIAAFEVGRRGRPVAGIILVFGLATCGLTNAQVDSIDRNTSKVEAAGELAAQVERLRLQARILLEEGKLEDAEQTLIQAQKLAPRFLELTEELKRMRERRMNGEALKREVKNPPENDWDSTTPRYTGTVSTRTNRVYSGQGRQKIVKKLNEIVIDYYEVPNALPLTEIIKDIYAKARKLDPENKGVNLIVSSHLDNSGIVPSDKTSGLTDLGTENGPLRVENYRVTISPALRDVTLQGLLDAIVEVAVPPGGHERAPGLRYSVEEYAVVFGQRRNEMPPLYTRTFKVDPNTFLQGLNFPDREKALAQAEGPQRNAIMQQAVREFFTNAGIDFTANSEKFQTDGTPSPQKAIFFNDRTGILFVRATRSDMDVVEKAVQTLDADGASDAKK